MSIQSTVSVSREWAMYRIRFVSMLVALKDWSGIEQNSFEPDSEPADYFSEVGNISLENLDNWTNSMLEQVMDQPYFRQSVFDNYSVENLWESKLVCQ